MSLTFMLVSRLLKLKEIKEREHTQYLVSFVLRLERLLARSFGAESHAATFPPVAYRPLQRGTG